MGPAIFTGAAAYAALVCVEKLSRRASAAVDRQVAQVQMVREVGEAPDSRPIERTPPSSPKAIIDHARPVASETDGRARAEIPVLDWPVAAAGTKTKAPLRALPLAPLKVPAKAVAGARRPQRVMP
ncbi:MAG: hypothetical protein ACREIA_01500 [Opitutaceae bacterium]